MIIIFWDFLMFVQNFFLQQVKRSVTSSYYHGINELSNDLRFRILEN